MARLEGTTDGLHCAALGAESLPVVLLNGPVCTSTGLYRVSELDVERARSLVRLYGWVSAVGHEAAAAVFSRILGVAVPMNRVEYAQQAGQLAIALQLRQRAREGQILSVEEMLQIGFRLLLLERLE
ncbi:MAG TPA: YddF family protein [Limnochordia bacterium]|nr:YddF family protein [Limnochordia bacterium]